MNFKEIAKILGRSEGALRVQMYRCIRNARDIKLQFYQLLDQLALSRFDRVAPLSDHLARSLVFVPARKKRWKKSPRWLPF